jgi:hypothetical protein
VRNSIRALVVLAAVLILPRVAFAQATIAGVVRDSSGGVLPGVTVEASSPALTEKVRTVLTDGTGQYRIVSLPVGTYRVTFGVLPEGQYQAVVKSKDRAEPAAIASCGRIGEMASPLTASKTRTPN